MKENIRPSDLRIGDRIRIIGIPGAGVAGYYLHADTKRAFDKLIARRRSVRIDRIDEYGSPWYTCRFRTKAGRWEWHLFAVCNLDNNWVSVKSRQTKL